MFVRFVVLTGAFLMVAATALMGQGFTCNDDRCCYPDGRCFRLPRPSEDKAAEAEKARQAAEAKAAEAEKARQAPSLQRPDLQLAPPAAPRPVPQSPSTIGQAPSPGAVRPVPQFPSSTSQAPSPGAARPVPQSQAPSSNPIGNDSTTVGSSTISADLPRLRRGRILETGYARLSEVGEEKLGYGLYSYVLITSYSNKSVALLDEIFKAIPNVKDTGALPNQINILYVPFFKEKEDDFAVAARSPGTLGAKYAQSFYNFRMARTILDHLCNPPADVLRRLCGSDLSRGPFIFTYEKPASTFQPVQAPYLFVDLRDVNEHAFAELVSAYQQQVKSEDVNSGERLNTLRLKFLNLTLNAADFFKPIPEALADVIHSAKP
jgi:hypothetical protein